MTRRTSIGRLAAIASLSVLAAGCGAAADPRPSAGDTASWHSAAPLAHARTLLAAAADGDGRIAVYGGVRADGWGQWTEIYDAATGRWRQTRAAAAAMAGSAAATGADGRVLVLGGWEPFNSQPVPWLEILGGDGRRERPVVEGHDMATARTYLAAASANGRVYALGGVADEGVRLAAAEVYAGGRWQPIPPLQLARGYLAATGLPGGDVLAIGGSPAAGRAVSRVDRYDASAGRWTPAPPLPAARFGLAAATARDGSVYAIGGADAAGRAHTDVYVLRPGASAWAAAPPLRQARVFLAAVLAGDGRIYAIGGSRAADRGERAVATALRTVEAFDPG